MALGRFDEAPALVVRLEAMGRELIRLTGGLSLESLRDKERPSVTPADRRQGGSP